MSTTMRMRAVITAAVLILGLSVLPLWAQGSGSKQEAADNDQAEPAQKAAEKSETVATVNKVIITREQFEREMESIKSQLIRMGRYVGSFQDEMLKKEVMNTLISRELLIQEIKTKDFSVDDAMISQQIMMLKGRFKTEQEFQEALKQMNVTEDELVARVRKDVTLQQFINTEFSSKIVLKETESKEYYDNNQAMFKQPEEVKASHILIKLEADADEKQKKEAREKLVDVKQKVEKGESFADLAKQYSQCPSSAKGGDLGSFRRGQMVKEFEETAFALKAGELSDVVETKFGYHLIKTVEKKEAGTVPFDQVRSQLEQYLKQEKMQKAVETHVEELKKGAAIEQFLSEEPKTPVEEKKPETTKKPCPGCGNNACGGTGPCAHD